MGRIVITRTPKAAPRPRRQKSGVARRLRAVLPAQSIDKSPKDTRKPEIRVRIPLVEGTILLDELSREAPIGCERVILALAGHTRDPHESRVLLRSLHPVPDADYMVSGPGTSWSTKFTASVISEAMRFRLGVFIIHSHGSSTSPRLSTVDHGSLMALLPALSTLVPDRPHGSLVLGSDWNLGGLVWLPGAPLSQLREVTRVDWLRNPVVTRPDLPMILPKNILRYDRQISLLGQAGQSRLYQSVIGLVGLGGGGSHVAVQAAHAGFGTILLVDNDVIEESNLSRLVGMGPADVGKPKVAAYASLLPLLNPETVVVPVQERFPSPKSVEILKQVDVLIGCVDTFHARKELQNFCWRYLIPFVDIGIGTSTGNPSAQRSVAAIDGHVHTHIPGGPCMWCVGLLSKERLELELAGQGPEYIRGAANPSQIVSFNGLVGSLGVIEAMRIRTGFLEGGANNRFFRFQGATNELLKIRASRDPACHVCTGELGMGEVVW